MNLLLDLTLRGSLAALVVMALDRSLAGRVKGSARRWWWWFVPIGFLVPLRIPLPVFHQLTTLVARPLAFPIWPKSVTDFSTPLASHAMIAVWIWIAGAFLYATAVAIQTSRALKRWSAERLSTDHELLEILEDCKAEAGVEIPIGLVVSNSVPSPAILGWVRPRILLPASVVASASHEEIRAIFFHELAHLRGCDVPFNWALTATRSAHWFNPFVHLAANVWSRFREEAADERAVQWMGPHRDQVYGKALLAALRRASDLPVPFGSMAIVESVRRLRKRMLLINRGQKKSPSVALAAGVSLLLAVIICAAPARTSPGASTDVGIKHVHAWLEEIDAGNYAQSWADASNFFRTRVTSDAWVGDLASVRSPLGKCISRQQVSSLVEKDPSTPDGKVKGEFLVVQFETSFEHMKHTIETVSFSKEPDGDWKAAGYVIHPG